MIRSKEELLTHMQGINKWIAENPDVTEPNMYEMIDCITNLAVLDGEGEQGLEDALHEFNKMYKVRFSFKNLQDPSYPVKLNSALEAYFTTLYHRCCTKEFKYPEDPAQRDEFLEFVKKNGSVSLYVNQQRLQNPDFKFDNQEEYQYLIDMSEKYKEYLPDFTDLVVSDVGKDIMLKDAKQSLLTRMQGINKWIAENPDITEPNMYEMIDCVTQLGIIAREEGVVNMPNKFPKPGSELAELYAEWNKIYRARMSWDKVQSPEFSANKDTNLYAYFTDLNMRCCTGEFRYPAHVEQRREFLECVKKIGSVSLYINQQRAQNPNFLYDNTSEYQELMSMAKSYSTYLPVHSAKVLDDISGSRVLAQPDNPGDDDAPGL